MRRLPTALVLVLVSWVTARNPPAPPAAEDRTPVPPPPADPAGPPVPPPGADPVEPMRARAAELLKRQAGLLWRAWAEGESVDLAATYAGTDDLFSRQTIDFVRSVQTHDAAQNRA